MLNFSALKVWAWTGAGRASPAARKSTDGIRTGSEEHTSERQGPRVVHVLVEFEHHHAPPRSRHRPPPGVEIRGAGPFERGGGRGGGGPVDFEPRHANQLDDPRG